MQVGADTVGATESLPGQVLIVDEDLSVRQSTDFALDEFELENHGLELTSAYSIKEAQEMPRRNRNMAVILIDVVMETESADQDYLRWLRHNHAGCSIRVTARPDGVGTRAQLIFPPGSLTKMN